MIGLIVAVVGAQINEHERTGTNYRLGPIEVNNFWGRKDQIMEAFRRPIVIGKSDEDADNHAGQELQS